MNKLVSEEAISEMKDSEEKKLMEILQGGAKAYVQKVDVIAIKVEEDKQIEYKDWENNERTLKVPAGSYVVVEPESKYPKIITAECFEAKYKEIGDKPKEKKKEDSPKLGMDLMT